LLPALPLPLLTGGQIDPTRSPDCHSGGSAFEPVTTPPPQARLALGLFYVQNLPLGILKAPANDTLVATIV